jgi:hypothetical protein
LNSYETYIKQNRTENGKFLFLLSWFILPHALDRDNCKSDCYQAAEPNTDCPWLDYREINEQKEFSKVKIMIFP